MKNPGMLLLAIWLILMGLINLLDLSFPFSDLVLGALALVSGILILINQRKIKITGNLGMTLLSLWLILWGVVSLLDLNFAYSGAILGLLATGAGVLLLLKR